MVEMVVDGWRLVLFNVAGKNLRPPSSSQLNDLEATSNTLVP